MCRGKNKKEKRGKLHAQEVMTRLIYYFTVQIGSILLGHTVGRFSEEYTYTHTYKRIETETVVNSVTLFEEKVSFCNKFIFS